MFVRDTAGEEKFDSLTNFYCRNAKAALICYDITSKETFDGLSRWIDKITAEADENCAIYILGNKLDIVEQNPAARQVTLEQATKYADSIKACILEGRFDILTIYFINLPIVFSFLNFVFDCLQVPKLAHKFQRCSAR